MPIPAARGGRDSWFQAWLLAQLQAPEKADVVVLLGGMVSKTANTLLHLAEAKGLPIFPFAFPSGPAGRAYQRRKWARLNPGFDVSVLANDNSIEQAVPIANRLLLDRIKRLVVGGVRPKIVFVSVARQDAAVGSALEGALNSQGIEVVLGDNEIGPGQIVSASIEQAIRRSDIVAVLRSGAYDQIAWCFDELSLAFNQKAFGA